MTGPEDTRGAGRRRRHYLRVVAAAGTGVFAFVLLFPFAGVDTQPPRYYSVFGNRVPTGTLWVAFPWRSRQPGSSGRCSDDASEGREE